MKRLGIVCVLAVLTTAAMAAGLALGRGTIVTPGGVGAFALGARQGSTAFIGDCTFVDVNPTTYMVNAAVRLHTVTGNISAGTVTMSGTGSLYQNGQVTSVPVTVTGTDSNSGNSFSITAGSYSASGTLTRGCIVVYVH